MSWDHIIRLDLWSKESWKYCWKQWSCFLVWKPLSIFYSAQWKCDLVGLDLCYEKIFFIFHIEIFELQKRVFHRLDLNPSAMLTKPYKFWNVCLTMMEFLMTPKLFISFWNILENLQVRIKLLWQREKTKSILLQVKSFEYFVINLF